MSSTNRTWGKDSCAYQKKKKIYTTLLHNIVASVINDFFLITVHLQLEMIWSQMLHMNFWAPLSWGTCVRLGSATVLRKWSCKDFGDLTCHQDLTYTSVHVIWENVSYSDDSLIFGTQSEDIHFLLLCWGLLTLSQFTLSALDLSGCLPFEHSLYLDHEKHFFLSEQILIVHTDHFLCPIIRDNGFAPIHFPKCESDVSLLWP